MNYLFAKGKRKEAVARVRLYKDLKEILMAGTVPVKKGEIFINNIPVSSYFPGLVSKAIYEQPFKITNTLGNYTVTARVVGGGNKSQLGAFIHGVARALSKIDEKNKQILRKKGFLTRDARVRQRRKVGMGGKSRRQKQSPKR